MIRQTHPLELVAAWLLALFWLAPLAYAFWSALHPAAYATSFSLSAPWTLENFSRAWSQAPFGRYYLNTVLLVVLVLAGQVTLDEATLRAAGVLAAFAVADFAGSVDLAIEDAANQLAGLARKTAVELGNSQETRYR